MRRVITPPPTADEAAAIDAALAILASRGAQTTRRLRFGDRRDGLDVTLTWTDVARREALGDV